MAICYGCGKPLKDAVGRVVDGVERAVGGNVVRLHKCCAKTFDSDHAYVRAITNEAGDTFSDDGSYSPLRSTFKREQP